MSSLRNTPKTDRNVHNTSNLTGILSLKDHF